MDSLARLLAEMRRRKVFRVAVAYAGAVFIVLQVASLTFDPLGLSERAYRWLVWLSIAGFPVALILAWLLDLRVTTEAPAAEPAAVEVPVERRPRVAVTAIGIAVLGLAVLAVVIGLRRPAGRDDVVTVAVLPFMISGHGTLSYLGEGVVDLLSRNLDGAEGLRAVAPELVLRAAATEKKKENAGAPGSAIAGRLGADLYLDGSIHQFRDSVRIYAQFRGASPASDTDDQQQVSVQGDTTQVVQLIDRLAAELLASRTRGHTAPFARTAAVTTASLPALKEFLAAERDLRARKNDSAIGRFQRAIVADSAFALAHYRLAVAAVENFSAKLARSALANAIKYQSRLNERDRALVRAFDAYLRGDADTAEREYRALLQRYPGDLEATYQLAETLVDYNPARGRSITETRPLYETVRKADPDFRCTVCGLLALASADRNFHKLDSLIKQFPSDSAADNRTKLLAQAGIAYTESDTAAQQIVLRDARARPEAAAVIGLILGDLELLEPADQFAGIARDHAKTARDKSTAFNVSADLEIARGRWRPAMQYLAQAGSHQGRPLALRKADYALLPFIPVPVEELQQIRREVAATDSTPPAHARFPREELRAQPREYYLAALSAKLGEHETALRHVDRLLELPVDSAWSSAVVALGQFVKVQVAMQQGKNAEALRLLESIPGQPPYGLHASELARESERWWRVELLIAAKRDRDALEYMEHAFVEVHDDLLIMAMLNLRRAEVHDRLGNQQKAIEHYARFLKIWNQADPVLRPIVARARERLAALRAPTG